MNELIYRRELQEALDAADEALYYLNQVDESLQSAGNWGIWDMLGGGFFSTFVKHCKMDDAETQMQSARIALQKLSRELEDVGRIEDFNIEVGDFLRFADYFFDGVVADWMVQSRIRDAKRQIEEAKTRVTGIRNQLSRQLRW